MEIRTDLALEKQEKFREKEVPGVVCRRKKQGNTVTTYIEVLNEEGEKAIGKPKGIYYTIETDGFPDVFTLCDERLAAVKKALSALVPKEGTVLVAGLGNTEITPDCLGPGCVASIFSTRHLKEENLSELGLPGLRTVCAVSPGVTGQTGLEASEIIAGICEKVNPAAVITVDALASLSVKRLVKTVQMSNVGIEPGSGVGNSRKTISRETLGVPVIAVGIPTVVDARSLAVDVFGESAEPKGGDEYSSFMVTPRNIDTVIKSASRFLSLAINSVLYPEIPEKELLALM